MRLAAPRLQPAEGACMMDPPALVTDALVLGEWVAGMPWPLAGQPGAAPPRSMVQMLEAKPWIPALAVA